MNVTLGVMNENRFVYELDNKYYKNLNQNLKFFIRYLFPFVNDDDLIHCFKTEDYIKPDIAVKWKDETKYVSLKYGTSETVHGESIQTFIDALKSLGANDEIEKIIKLFLYGDGTTDGTGTERKNGAEIRYELRNEILLLNKFLNKDKNFVKEVIDRCLFKGVNPLAHRADYIYHGDVEFGNFVSRNQIMKHINIKSWDFMDCPHIGPLVFRPHARYAGKEVKVEKRRHEVTITWPNIEADIKYIFKRYNF